MARLTAAERRLLSDMQLIIGHLIGRPSNWVSYLLGILDWPSSSLGILRLATLPRRRYPPFGYPP
eukprot:1158946-Pelagomonas_calceolata.AAC.6